MRWSTSSPRRVQLSLVGAFAVVPDPRAARGPSNPHAPSRGVTRRWRVDSAAGHGRIRGGHHLPKSSGHW